MRAAMHDAGAAIFLTSVTACLAFLSGVMTDMPAVSTFCCVAFWAFLWNYVLNVTFFPALVCVDVRRQQAKRHYCCPCAKVGDARVGDATLETGEAPPDCIDRAVKALLDRLQRLLATPERCAAVLFCCLAGAAFSLALFPRLGVGLEARDVVPDDSYMIDFFDSYDVYWPGKRVWYSSLVVKKDSDYADVGYRTRLGYDANMTTRPDSLFGRVEARADCIGRVGDPTTTWLRRALAYNGGGGAALTDAQLRSALGGTIHPVEDLVCQRGDCEATNFTDGVASSRQYFYHLIDDDTIAANRVRGKYEDVVDDAGFEDEAYVWSEMFMYGASDSVVRGFTFASVCIASVVIFAVVAAFLDVRAAVACTTTVLIVDVDLVGLMVAWDVPLNAVAYTVIVMGIGLCVDYCVHMAHGFAHSSGGPLQRVAGAYAMMGSAVVKGAFTTFLGILFLANASSSVFRTFFKLLFGTVAFGAIHGLLLTPVLLAIIYKVAPPKGADMVGTSAVGPSAPAKADPAAEESKGGLA